MRYLVTGGAGFIGSNLVKDLVRDGHEVVVIDDLSSGSLDNLSEVYGDIVFLRWSSGDVDSSLGNIDGIFHLGMPSCSVVYRDDRYLVGDAITEFVNLIEFVKDEGCRLVLSSTSSIYQNNRIPYEENMRIWVTDFYTEARYTMERLCSLYNSFYGVSAITLRFFSVYGPGEKSKGKLANMVSQFLWAMKEGESPVIYGDGEQQRDFIYVGDVVRAMRTAMDKDIPGLFNVGTGRNYTLNQLVEVLNKVLETNIKPEYVENPFPNYVYDHKAYTERADVILGFKAQTSLEDGIRSLI